jgi:hypothetical protein
MAHRLAVVTVVATLLLILFGGLVTNTGAALAVPDWPTTFGHNMFLFPWSQMAGGIFYEHSHRLIGAGWPPPCGGREPCSAGSDCWRWPRSACRALWVVCAFFS